MWFDGKCNSCNKKIQQSKTGEPYLPFKNLTLCSSCYINLIPEIYKMAGYGDGGIIHIVFESCLKNIHNKTKRYSLKQCKKIFKTIMKRYNFKCVFCDEKETEKLTIDHIMPVSKRGTDDLNNLQILCKSCNSKKGAKYPYEMVQT